MTKSFRLGPLIGAASALLAVTLTAPTSAANATEAASITAPTTATVTTSQAIGAVNSEPSMEPIPLKSRGEFLVQFRNRDDRPMRKILAEAGVSLSRNQMSALRGPVFNGTRADISRQQARILREAGAIKAVERIQTFSVQKTPQPTLQTQEATSLWNLDRINQRQLPLDGMYNPFDDGAATNIYIVDSGVNDIPGQFVGRYGDSAYVAEVAANSSDCEGHGTHVAGTAASTSYGAAKGATIHSVRVLNCAGEGNTATILAGLNWVAENAKPPAIVNLSLGGPKSAINNSAVQQLDQLGILTVAAAGNEAVNACATSPASAPDTLTVSASNQSDAVPTFSNFGSCVDVFAPGTDITSLSLLGPPIQLSGTSMAAPAATGVAAVLWEANPSATPAQIREVIVGSATSGALQLTNAQSNSPNLLLYVDSQKPSLSVPSKVKKLKAKDIKKSQVKTKWKQPKNNGGIEITKYKARIKEKGKNYKSWKKKSAKSGKTSYDKKWKNLKSGKKYVVQVAAKNAVGVGKTKKVTFRTKS